MVLSNNTLNEFERRNINETNERLFRSLKSAFPNEIVQLSKQHWIETIIQDRLRCDSLLIFTEKGILGYLMIRFLFGEKFYSESNFLNIFKIDSISGDQAMELFYEKLKGGLN